MSFFSPGLNGLLYLPSNVLSILLRDQGQQNQQENNQEQTLQQEKAIGQEMSIWHEKKKDWENEQEIEDLRVLLCSIHIQTRYITATISSNFFFFNFLWRTFLILHAEGFIHNGKLNLGLFCQLFWLITLTFITVAYTIFPGSILLRGKFPQQSTSGQICLLKPFGRETGKEILKRNGVALAAGFIMVFFVFYFYWKSKGILKTYCPHNKMSCIGRYKRNVINYRETTAMTLTFSILGIFDVLLVILYKNMNLTSWNVYLLDFVIWVLLFELISLALTLIIWSKEIPSYITPPKSTQFYVRSPLVLTPRRPLDPIIPMLPPLERRKAMRRPGDPLNPSLTPPLRSKGKGRGKNRGKNQTVITMQTHKMSSQRQRNLPAVN